MPMQEQCTTVELYGTLTELPYNQQIKRVEGLAVTIQRNERAGTRTFKVINIMDGAILAMFDVLDIEGNYSEVRNDG